MEILEVLDTARHRKPLSDFIIVETPAEMQKFALQEKNKKKSCDFVNQDFILQYFSYQIENSSKICKSSELSVADLHSVSNL